MRADVSPAVSPIERSNQPMRNPIRTFTLALTLCTAPALLHAQTTVVTTAAPTVTTGAATTTTETTTSAGTVTEFTPTANRIIVRTSAGAPATYSVTKQTTYVDEAGNVVSAEMLRPGIPTTVYYTTVGGVPTVSKVVVTKTAVAAPAPVVVPAARTTTTETTETTTTTRKK